MGTEIEMHPKEIERRSFAIIRRELEEQGMVLPERESAVIMRCIHTSADFSYARTLVFSPGALEAAMALLREGATPRGDMTTDELVTPKPVQDSRFTIVTDTNMALAGVNKTRLGRLGGQAVCFMADESVAAEAKSRGITRAAVAMEKAAQLAGPVILAVGNAPTALLSLHDLINDGALMPGLVIGVPVGFVNVVEAKQTIMEDPVPYIVNTGRKGGSSIAAAIVNALLIMAEGERTA